MTTTLPFSLPARLRSRLRIMACVGLLAIFAAPRHVEAADSMFPAYCDDDTAALWLFDEPSERKDAGAPPVRAWYYTQTITDAGADSLDLHRLNGGTIEKGRFGRALRVHQDVVGPGMKLAANYASEPRVYGVFLPADHEFVPRSEGEVNSVPNFFWYTVRPDRLLDAITGDAWTIEVWVKMASGAPGEVCLIDAGQGRRTALRLDLEATSSGKALRVRIPAAGIEALCPLGAADLSQWNHLAIVKRAGSAKLTAFVDGKEASRTAFKAAPPAAPVMKPGLVARCFAELDFQAPDNLQTIADLGAPLAEVAGRSKSVRLRGWIRAPFTGNVRFETGDATGLRLDVDQRPLVYGWFGRAAMYRRSPRWGVVAMEEGKLYPVLIEMQLNDGDPPLAGQLISWSWSGAAKQAVPASAWAHSQDDQDDAQADQGGGFEPTVLMTTRFNFVLGSDRAGQHAMDGSLDEVRVSRVARYDGAFTPSTHSMNYGAAPQPESKPSGPPPLDFGDRDNAVVKLESRKHLLFDDALIAERKGVEFVVNPPSGPQAIEPAMSGGDHTFFDLDGEVALFAPAGYEGREDFAHLWLSEDGVHFHLHEAQTAGREGQPPQPIATGVPAWGRMAIDENPACPPWAKFKFTAGVPHRGIYLLTSPDAIHWRRNETVMLQVGTGGESHWYWDDQRGEYRYLLKWDHGPGGRQPVEADTRQCFEPWPLSPTGDPSVDLVTPFGFMPPRFTPDEQLGEVYRCRVTKYAWAPDAYFAFIWRFDRQTQARQVELAASRDGTHWKHFGKDWYMPAEFSFDGKEIHEVTSVDGLVRRGDDILQYADYSTGRHDGRAPAWRVRVKQRLDGFASLDAGDAGGGFTTKPMVFTGERLVVNAAAKSGFVKAAVLNADGAPLAGFGLDDCEPASGDATSQTISWRGEQRLRDLAGKPVRLHFEMKNAKLFALQFE